MSDFAIDQELCRGRQARLLAEMENLGVDLVVLTQRAHVQWLTGCYFPWLFEPAVALTAGGHCLLAAPGKFPEDAAADEVSTYEEKWLSTMRNDQRAASSDALASALEGKTHPKRLGVEFSTFGMHLLAKFDAQLMDVEPFLLHLRRRKDADELALIKKAIDGTAAMYARAREIIAPGLNELEMFNQLQAAAVEQFGEMLTGTGNDYACGARGGPPRDRVAQDGELYILDLGPAFRGYFADNCRTLAVNRRPTDVQQQAWDEIASVFPLVENTVKPGVSCKAFYQTVKDKLDAYLPEVFNHHLGHGIGLFPHEGPHVNPNWDDTFEVGDVFTIEPGLYTPEINAGIRLENDYLVTEDGVELLSDFPLGL